MSEFIDKWKRGILSITELQKIKNQIVSTWIIITGIFLGFVAMLYNAKTWWWAMIILVGAFLNTTVSLIGLYQKRKWLVEIEKSQKEVCNG